MSGFSREFIAAAKQSPRMYFAPIAAAYRAIAQEFRTVGRQEQGQQKRHKHA
jgi:hypothetical protein